jgi:DNA ligase 1
MTDFKKPMLAATAKTIEDIKFPCLASPKLDGVRCISLDNVAYSRSMKLIPNKFIQAFFAEGYANDLDGELIIGEPTAPNVYNTTVSGVMKHDGEPDFRFYVFDDPTLDDSSFAQRLEEIRECLTGLDPRVIVHEQIQVRSAAQLAELEAKWVGMGYEGVITRSPGANYKQGRSTLREQGMVKLKRFQDSEAEIIGFEELMHNENATTVSEIGSTVRSSHREGLIPAGTLGAIYVRDISTGVDFKIGTGFDSMARDYFWRNRDNLTGKIVKYKFFPVGVKERPRHPVYLGLRSPEDM